MNEKMSKAVNYFLYGLKLLVFGSLVGTAAVMYKIGSPQWGNDLLLTAGILLCLNKLDNLGG